MLVAVECNTDTSLWTEGVQSMRQEYSEYIYVCQVQYAEYCLTLLTSSTYACVGHDFMNFSPHFNTLLILYDAVSIY
jgi:hypothetical protein